MNNLQYPLTVSPEGSAGWLNNLQPTGGSPQLSDDNLQPPANVQGSSWQNVLNGDNLYVLTPGVHKEHTSIYATPNFERQSFNWFPVTLIIILLVAVAIFAMWLRYKFVNGVHAVATLSPTTNDNSSLNNNTDTAVKHVSRQTQINRTQSKESRRVRKEKK